MTDQGRMSAFKRDRDQMCMDTHAGRYDPANDTMAWDCGHTQTNVGGMVRYLDMDCPHNEARLAEFVAKYPDHHALGYVVDHGASE